MLGYSEFGIAARVIMLKKNITMASLAKELGISAAYVSDILRGVRRGKKYRDKIAQILGMEYNNQN